jgi:hypothetical protein
MVFGIAGAAKITTSTVKTLLGRVFSIHLFLIFSIHIQGRGMPFIYVTWERNGDTRDPM